MAIGKQVKVGGSYYKGDRLIVESAAGDYVLFAIMDKTAGSAVNSVSMTPMKSGNLDTMKLEHVNGTSAGSAVVALIAENMYNRGGGVSINLDFIAIEKLDAGHSIKFTYGNVAEIAMDVFILVERGR